MAFALDQIPDQTGRRAIVTGASGGLGFEVARALAERGGSVIIAARDQAKGEAAASAIGQGTRFEPLDLADLASVEAFASRALDAGDPIDLLVNNAGLAGTPRRKLTKDGFELQFGTNFLGHFALTGRLLPLLRAAATPRVVSLSSLVEKTGRIDFADLMGERSYAGMRAYAQSKLAVLSFAIELQRRADGNGWGLLSLAAHPGVARTELAKARPGQPVSAIARLVELLVMPVIAHDAAGGALPTLYAATAADVRPGGYYGPVRWRGMKGPPGPATAGPAARDPRVAERLWTIAEALTGVRYDWSKTPLI